MTRILILDGHPDANPARFCHALADAYASGAIAGGHEVRRIRLCDLDFPTLTRRADWEGSVAPDAVATVQADITWAGHIVILYPLWLGSMPARLKALFEQTFRPGYAFGQGERSIGDGRLKGRSARIIVTMGMPAAFFRGFYLSHSLEAFRRNILAFVGIGPARSSLVGNVEGLDDAALRRWLDRVAGLGRQAR